MTTQNGQADKAEKTGAADFGPLPAGPVAGTAEGAALAAPTVAAPPEAPPAQPPEDPTKDDAPPAPTPPPEQEAADDDELPTVIHIETDLTIWRQQAPHGTAVECTFKRGQVVKHKQDVAEIVAASKERSGDVRAVYSVIF